MEEKRLLLAHRSEFFRAVRNFFYDAGFIEVETPVKIHAPAPEEYIESVQSEGDFLRTSPELAMKVLLSEGCERIFQIGSCFRADEVGRKHLEEFTMLEFYAAGWNYRELAEFTAAMLESASGGDPLFRDFEFVTVDEAYRRYAGVSAFDALCPLDMTRFVKMSDFTIFGLPFSSFTTRSSASILFPSALSSSTNGETHLSCRAPFFFTNASYTSFSFARSAFSVL